MYTVRFILLNILPLHFRIIYKKYILFRNNSVPFRKKNKKTSIYSEIIAKTLRIIFQIKFYSEKLKY